ncbi:hypothetical protein SAMN05216436_1203 [bacterium A37T11]|nr:hypothetical protein SAMN05216436_1203 [bacterium A37T11]
MEKHYKTTFQADVILFQNWKQGSFVLSNQRKSLKNLFKNIVKAPV